jgi:hypothetical protein
VNRVNGDGWRGSQQERGGLCLCLCLCITGCRLPLLLAAGQVYRRRHASGARCPPPLHTARRRQHYWGARQRWRRRLRPPGVPGLKEVIDGSLSLSLLFSSLSFPFFLWWKGRTMLRVFFYTRTGILLTVCKRCCNLLSIGFRSVDTDTWVTAVSPMRHGIWKSFAVRKTIVNRTLIEQEKIHKNRLPNSCGAGGT